MIHAPRDGRILRILGRDNATMVKKGDVIATFAPKQAVRVVELYVDGRDVPLIHPARPVRMEFEGWPAIQFSGWPSVAVGMVGYYGGTYADAKVARPLENWGGQVYGGYRASVGRFPIYEDKNYTNQLGEIRAGAVFALLRDRMIDDRRFGRVTADAEHAVTDAERPMVAIGVQGTCPEIILYISVKRGCASRTISRCQRECSNLGEMNAKFE